MSGDPRRGRRACCGSGTTVAPRPAAWSSTTRLLIAVVAASSIGFSWSSAPAASAVKLVKQCGRIADPRTGGKVRVDIAEGEPIRCARARRVMRAYLRRVPTPRQSNGSNRTVRVSGRAWECCASRSFGRGPGWDYLCSSSPNYTAIGGNLRQ